MSELTDKIFAPEIIEPMIAKVVNDIMQHGQRVALGDRSCGGPEHCGKCLKIMTIKARLQREEGNTG